MQIAGLIAAKLTPGRGASCMKFTGDYGRG